MSRSERAIALYNRLIPETLFEKTSIFSTNKNLGIPGLTPAMVMAIRDNYTRYFENWVEQDLKDLLPLPVTNKKLSAEMRRALEAIKVSGKLERFNGLYWAAPGAAIHIYCKGTDKEFSLPVNSFNSVTILSLLDRGLIETFADKIPEYVKLK